jgi:hypothetical protein
MQFVKNKKGEFVLDDKPMCLTGEAAAAARAELERGTSSNPRRDQVLAASRVRACARPFSPR